jgi:hypothetical protein
MEIRLPVSGFESCPRCHPERSEGSGSSDAEILRFAQDDRPNLQKSTFIYSLYLMQTICVIIAIRIYVPYFGRGQSRSSNINIRLSILSDKYLFSRGEGGEKRGGGPLWSPGGRGWANPTLLGHSVSPCIKLC